MRKSNVKLCSNISLLTSELLNDTKFHSKVRGRKALAYLASKINNKSNSALTLNNLQVAELTHAGVTLDNCKHKNSWGLVVDENNEFYVECRCHLSECPQFKECLNNKIYMSDVIKKINNNQKEDLMEKIIIDIINDCDVIEKSINYADKEVSNMKMNTNLTHLSEQKSKIDKVENEFLMSCLVSIERISGSIEHLKDITERLGKDVNEIRIRLHAKITDKDVK
ncbi:hypothetical protein [Clostridium sp. 'deep sea']|uniref:hypothetical protein n=1 Tax=Clostridium sp. 'deep sea' TaxID=2779445 RepID=UPI001A9C1D41|nr:hypothetical protein [Clostridium sp. 'deep sea']